MMSKKREKSILTEEIDQDILDRMPQWFKDLYKAYRKEKHASAD